MGCNAADVVRLVRLQGKKCRWPTRPTQHIDLHRLERMVFLQMKDFSGIFYK
jgi:hypothetical protein